MTKQEINDWIKSTKIIDYDLDRYDENGNHDQTIIYLKEDKFYAIDYTNDYPAGLMEEYEYPIIHPYSIPGQKGWRYVKDQYAPPREVVRKTEMIERVYYE